MILTSSFNNTAYKNQPIIASLALGCLFPLFVYTVRLLHTDRAVENHRLTDTHSVSSLNIGDCTEQPPSPTTSEQQEPLSNLVAQVRYNPFRNSGDREPPPFSSLQSLKTFESPQSWTIVTSPTLLESIRDFLNLSVVHPCDDDDGDAVAEILYSATIPAGVDQEPYLKTILEEARLFCPDSRISNERKIEYVLLATLLAESSQRAPLDLNLKRSLADSLHLMKDSVTRGRFIHFIAQYAGLFTEQEKEKALALFQQGLSESGVSKEKRCDVDNQTLNQLIGSVMASHLPTCQQGIDFLNQHDYYLGDVTLFFNQLETLGGNPTEEQLDRLARDCGLERLSTY